MELSEAATKSVVAVLRRSGSVFADAEAALLISEASIQHELDDMVNRRVDGVPIEYIVGWVEFCRQRIYIEDGVFVPRWRTEFLACQAIAVARRPSPVVVDLCCGSGAVGLAILSHVNGTELHAVDIDAAAVGCARRNIGHLGAVYQGDLYGPLPDGLKGRVDILVANAPYVPSHDIALMPREARLYEPLPALDGGADGLDVQRRIAADARLWLSRGGYLLMETSQRQASATMALCSDEGLSCRVIHRDDGDASVVAARLDQVTGREVEETKE